MTDIALISCGIAVTTWQTVTTATATIDLTMINPHCWRPTIGGMAGFTNICGIDVTTWQAMAARTSAIHFIVIHGNHRRPTQRTMAGLT